MNKKQHPTFKRLSASEDGTIWYENGNKVPTNKKNTREQFTVKENGKSKNFGVRRFIWECMTGEILDKKWVIVGKDDSNKFKDLKKITKSEHYSNIYTEIWRKKRNEQ